jgi:hypothetical protein
MSEDTSFVPIPSLGYNAAILETESGGSFMGTRRRVIPSGATILAWLGVIGTLLGIFGFFVSDLPGILGNNQNQGLNEQDIVATLSALQDDKERAELQLTAIAVANQQAANQSTQQAIAQQQAEFQATLDAVRAEQEAFVSTQNAIAAVTATFDAANALGTQAALDVTATAAAIAQIPPTDTPAPTITPTPAPVGDFRSLVDASARTSDNGRLGFSMQTEQAIPDPAPDGLTYVWSLDTDRDPATGLAVQDIGVDMRITVKYDSDSWIGTVRSVAADGTLGDPFLFLDIRVEGASVSAILDGGDLGIPGSFDWVARVELEGQAYSFFPESGHLRYP